ncbi:hypothetical protein FEE96_04865 [Parasedimentitalea maritima]|uniref:Tripartite tricarboxylate transporter TctB family protein n=1 Tax=Parasedimentitalea maritima TaxID=2578117 RepID=A0ABY2V3W4_9RHOB|nr:hypothetical protein [Zongyanglinia marina]TLP67863.1 hypothetical protein FEE96_04865 [Zongyanglinia marina]
MTLFGVFMMGREILKHWSSRAKKSSTVHSGDLKTPMRQTSGRAKVICSLLGVVLGGLACLYLALVAAAGQVETEQALQIAFGGVALSIFLLLVAVTTGIVGIFKRGYALGRVPGYFVIGAVLAFSTIRYFRINLLEWQQFAEVLH